MVTPGVPVVALAANIESRRFSWLLRRHIRIHRPDVVIVEQAYRARPWLRRIARKLGYAHVQFARGEFGSNEAHGIAVLVRRDVKIKRRMALVMDRRWVGPKAGKWHDPRVYPALVLRKQGVTFRALGIHFPTHNQPAAQAESMRAVKRYFRNHPNSPVVAAGDWNRVAGEMWALADDCDAELLPLGKVDHALVRNVNPRDTERLPKPRYAHGWALYRLTIR
jgi:endonuclease/exonuclease/phosphatase family metal-dependent hydrolase